MKALTPACSLLRHGLLLTCLTVLAHAAPPAGIQPMPFAPKSGQATKMTFTAIPAAESGLTNENPYDDPAMWGRLYTEFQGGAIGSGIATGDIDGDGLVDIYVANKNRPNKLYKQVAPFKFVDITAEAGVDGGEGWHTGVTMADVNNDGFLDIYVCRFNQPNLLYLNDGHGHFREAGKQAGIDLVSGSVVGAFADYDRDGHLDLFVLTNVLDAVRAPDGEPDRLYHNRGDGTFEEVTAISGLGLEQGRGHGVIWFDYNDDGWPDLYVTNDFTPSDHFYRNNGNGTFTDVLATAVPHTTWFSMGADAADINNDGRTDLMVAEMAGTTHYKSKVSMGDMGGLVDRMDTLVTPQYMKNAVFVNSGTDRFLEVAKMTGLGSTDWSWSTRFEDLDNDGRVDLHVTNGMVRTFINSDLLNQAKLLQSPTEIAALMRRSPVQHEVNLTLRNDGDLHFTKVQQAWGLDHDGVSFGSSFADFDNDGDLDLVYVNYEGSVSLYRNDCPAGHSMEIALHGTQSNTYGVGATVLVQNRGGQQVRQLTVARGSMSSSQPIMHFGLGDQAGVDSLEIRWPSGVVQKFGAMPADARYVVTEPADPARRPTAVASRPVDKGLFMDHSTVSGLDFKNQERPFNDMKRQSLLPHRMNTLGGGLAWGDVNGDHLPDLFFAGAAGHGSALYLADGRGGFTFATGQQPWAAHPETEGMAPLLLDVDRDGDLDLLVTAGSTEAEPGSDDYRSRLYLNDGRGVFTEAPAGRLANPPVSSAPAVAGDFNHDGLLDVFIGGRVMPGEYPSTPTSRLLENRQGTLVDVTDTLCPTLREIGMVTAALWTDVDGDGWSDLLVIGEWMSPRLFHNNQGKAFTEITAESGLAAHTGWWNSLVAADVNNDGAMDYIAGNVGLNTKYHANASHPVGIYYADFEGSGKKEIVEAEWEGDRLFPVRGRSCSSRAMPSLKKKFPTFHDWGAALLPEIYPEEKLASAQKVTATELASGVFLNDGKGHFTFRALPRLAQTAPIFGLVAGDFNGDGNIDLVAAQNFYGPQVETGRYDGGLSILLLGDGQGGFTPAAPAESGIAVSGEGRGLTTADLNNDGWPDLVMTRTNEPVLVLVNRGAPGAQAFSVALSGPAGNADAIGSQITLRFADGRTRTAELFAGSGYLSQSQPVAFFTYREGAAPTAIDVRWPDGTKSHHPFKAGSNRLTLQNAP